MKKKVLFVSNTANFSKFNLPFMRWCLSQGWRVDYCAPDDEEITECSKHIVLPIPRNPFSGHIFYCINKLRKILREEKYDIIHCHTPMGGVIARLAAKNLFKKHKVKIIYTAHGFHFFKGASLKNWMIYYPVEKYLSNFTDILITINTEDYKLAKEKFNTDVFFFNGVGVDTSKYVPAIDYKEKDEIRRIKGFSSDDFILLYVAEFIPRKNHKLLFDILPELQEKIPTLKVVLAGKGILLEKYRQFVAENNLNNIVTFLGYTKEVSLYCKLSDILFMPSFQEGLPISMIEAMATGLPIVASNIRGHNDVIISNDYGRLCELSDKKSFINSVVELYQDRDLCKKISTNNIERAKIYSTEIAVKKMAELYLSCIQ